MMIRVEPGFSCMPPGPPPLPPPAAAPPPAPPAAAEFVSNEPPVPLVVLPRAPLAPARDFEADFDLDGAGACWPLAPFAPPAPPAPPMPPAPPAPFIPP